MTTLESEPILAAIKKMQNSSDGLDSGLLSDYEQDAIDTPVEKTGNTIKTKRTGPKGVKHDKLDFDRKQKQELEAQKINNHEKLHNKILSKQWLQKSINQEPTFRGNESDAEFLTKYRSKRLAQLKKTRFTGVLDLEQTQFVDTIDSAPKNCDVVIHLYDMANENSRLVDKFIETLSKNYSSTKFCKILDSKDDQLFTDIILPAIIVYRNGKVEKILLRIADEIPSWKDGYISYADFEDYLQKQGVLDEQEKGDVTDDEFDEE